jgi:hypothetical protein
MRITFYRTRQGREEQAPGEFLASAREEGYDGVEDESMPDGLGKYGLKLKGTYRSAGASDFTQHAKDLETGVRSLLEAKPFLISLHTGKDHFRFDQNTQLLLMSRRIAQERKVSIIQGTQRGKCCFAVHVAQQYLEAMPWLKLDLDLSQWYTVAGSYLEDQAESVELALSRTVHVQARMGEMQDLEQYLAQWDKVVEKHHKMGTAELGFTCDLAMKNILMNRYVK